MFAYDVSIMATWKCISLRMMDDNKHMTLGQPVQVQFVADSPGGGGGCFIADRTAWPSCPRRVRPARARADGLAGAPLPTPYQHVC